MYITEAAYNFLIRYRITNLNFSIKLLKEIAILNNWQLCKYSSNQKLIYNLKLEENLALDAFTFLENNEIMIFYNDDLQENDILFNILHEFGHILLKHSSSKNILGSSLLKKTLIRQENEANMFACEVLAPSCIFKEMDIYNIEDIIKLSKLPIEHINEHIPNITNFSSLDDISERLIKIFNEYIIKNKHSNEEIPVKPKKYKQLLLTVPLVLIIIVIFSFIGLNYNKVYQNTNVDNNTFNASTQPIQSNIDNNTIFYATGTGTKYHLKNCRYVKDKSNLIEIKATDLLLNDYEPCSICIK